MKKLKMLFELIRFQSLPKDECQLIFYSEGKNYWPYLKGLLESVASLDALSICYVTSDKDDPGLCFEHSRINHFIIDVGVIRNWFFVNMKSGVVVMTMPDLGQYQVKRSTSPEVHYVYVQHSLVSLHMIYREGAFDHYDTIFCCGPHHVREAKAIEKLNRSEKKNVFEHGYPFLDELVATREHYLESTHVDLQRNEKHILVAPSWGEHGLVESGLAEKVIDKLLRHNYRVTLRPHPETNKHSPDAVSKIVKKHESDGLFAYESNIVGQTSLFESDIMVCDWSGVALEYAFAFNKPVVFFDSPRKINNPNYIKLEIEPFEVSVREKVGTIATLDNILEKIESIKVDENVLSHSIFHRGSSSEVGASKLLDIALGQS